MSLKLDELPVETIARVFGFLDFYGFIAVSQLNHFFRDLMDNFTELKYSLELQLAGMVDVNSTLDVRSKMEELERRERAWRRMDLSRSVTVYVPHLTSHIYDLSGGIYLLGDCKDAYHSRETRSLRFLDLTTCSSGSYTKRTEPWPELRLETNIIDIGFSVTEFDLIAVVGIKDGQDQESDSIVLSLRELSTGLPHPLAREPDIVVGTSSTRYQGKMSIMLEVVGPRLLLLLTWQTTFPRTQTARDMLVLFDWWDGKALQAESAEHGTWHGFIFISPELVLLPNQMTGLEIIRLPDVASGYSPSSFERLLTLQLPALKNNCSLGYINCRAEPNPLGEPHPVMQSGRGTAKERDYVCRMEKRQRPPVAPDPANAVVLMQINYRELNNTHTGIIMGQWGVDRHNVSLIVHRAALLELAKSQIRANKDRLPETRAKEQREDNDGVVKGEGERGSRVAGENEANEDEGNVENENENGNDEREKPPVVPWAKWGYHTRWQADETHVSNWITTSAGQRYVGSDEDGHIIVKDFNPLTVRRARAAALIRGDDEDDEDDDAAYAPPKYSSDTGSDFEARFDSDWVKGEGAKDDVKMQEAESDAHIPPPSSLTHFDTSWKSVRVIEGYSELEDIELRLLFEEECKWPLPCVEYRSKKSYPRLHGLLMDEERIIGLTHDTNTGAVVHFTVFTL